MLCRFYTMLDSYFTSFKVDVLGTLALLAEDPSKPGVSVEINVSYLSAAKVSTYHFCHLHRLHWKARFNPRNLTSL
jgi:hypothetical protein